MTDSPPSQPPGWYHAQGDPPGTRRYWDGTAWQGGPQPAPPGAGPVPGPGPGGGGGREGELATPGARVAARVVDWLIWLAVGVVVGVAVGGDTTSSVDAADFGVRTWLTGVVSTLVVMAYEVWFVANKGGTPGKLALGLRVARADTHQTPVDYQTAVLRVVPVALGILPAVGGMLGLFVLVISLVLLLSDRRRQTVWDKLAKTVVIVGPASGR